MLTKKIIQDIIYLNFLQAIRRMPQMLIIFRPKLNEVSDAVMLGREVFPSSFMYTVKW